jgi:hypothetical protein
MNDLNLGELNDIKINNEAYEQMWKDLIQVDGFKEYLKETMEIDVKKHFISQPAGHERIIGHFSFAQYLYNMITKTGDKNLTSL